MHHGRGKGQSVVYSDYNYPVFAELRTEYCSLMIEKFGPFPAEPPPFITDADFGHDLPHPELNKLAGIVTQSDWIASDEKFFPPGKKLSFSEIEQRAAIAVDTLGIREKIKTSHKSFFDLFGIDKPFPTQKFFESRALPPGSLVIIEAPMGYGKTEAALMAFHKSISDGNSRGMYFALPTQTTSNMIHERLLKFIKKSGIKDKIRLIHGSSWMQDNGSDDVVSEESIREKWFVPSKRAITANIGVGTIDQALLGVIRAKHFFLRQHGLSEKIVILDEIHSYDFYTGMLIGRLVETLRLLGSTVILLSATLSTDRRRELLGSSRTMTDKYPLITVRHPDGVIEEIGMPIDVERRRKITIVNTNRQRALREVVDRASAGECVVWICNTVSSAQETYDLLRGSMDGNGVKIGLLHANYVPYDRGRIEDEWIGILGKDGVRPDRGCILVSTQIVEQSVDIDADLIISELAPTDMLLQRIGRLWRHCRPGRRGRPEFWIITGDMTDLRSLDSADRIKRELGVSAYVYAPYILVRTWMIWSGMSEIDIPEDIRGLVDDTYRPINGEPETWRELCADIKAEVDMLRSEAEVSMALYRKHGGNDDHVSTRYSDQETGTILLVTDYEVDGDTCRMTLLDGNHIVVKDGKKFNPAIGKAIFVNTVKTKKRRLPNIEIPTQIGMYIQGYGVVGMLKNDCIYTVDGNPMALQYDHTIGLRSR